ncbi:NAD(P)H-hydrate dehydratase [Deinococcus roseus]|uniref:ADP-dependent (S)-NAD(P)H-hydrate dehydratase n=1 Tax=Deinococcus roseus TaxID=392414 RepID=A0ABQ2DGR2_9DEIO|nr:NAD(P)H-hydrate dehydratase [Deinococcus roseus]GGJ54292.1 bifunctional NAD(P)H-hydrate repair enzyme [Deinococcus roseus]
MALILTSRQIKKLDQTLAEKGLLEVTVENAGRSVAEALHRSHAQARVLVVAGKGFNGADALVAARHLLTLGHEIRVLVHPEAHPDSLQKLQVFAHTTPLNNEQLRLNLPQVDVVLEGLLGTGFRPPLSLEYASWIELLNASRKPVLSIDLPSGVQADVPVLPELAVRATRTLALGGFKPCHLFEPASEWAGEVELLSIGVPGQYTHQFTSTHTMEAYEVRQWLPRRNQSAHKGSAGEVWVLGGKSGMTGCVALTALAALRTGSGLVRYSSIVPIDGAPLEAIGHALKDWQEVQNLPFKGAVALGMGLGEQAAEVADWVLKKHIPTVIDADALQTSLRGKGHEWAVFTPHPGEAARMLETDTAEVLADPLTTVKALQKQYGGVVVLKGGPTVTATKQTTWVNTTGNPGMASAGMGDTLAGIIASLLGQGLSAKHAALSGVYLHGLAGDLCFKHHHYGLQASDVSRHLGTAWHTLIHGD